MEQRISRNQVEHLLTSISTPEDTFRLVSHERLGKTTISYTYSICTYDSTGKFTGTLLHSTSLKKAYAYAMELADHINNDA